MRNLITSAIHIDPAPIAALGFTQIPRHVYNSELLRAGGNGPTDLDQATAMRIDDEAPLDTDIVVDLEYREDAPDWINMDPTKGANAPDKVLRTLDRFATWRSWFPKHARRGRLSFWYLLGLNETYRMMRIVPGTDPVEFEVSEEYLWALEFLKAAGAGELSDRVVVDIYRRPGFDDRYNAWKRLFLDYCKMWRKPLMVMHSPLRPGTGETLAAPMFEADVRTSFRFMQISAGDRMGIWIPSVREVRNADGTWTTQRREWSETEYLGNSIRRLLGTPTVTPMPPREVGAVA